MAAGIVSCETLEPVAIDDVPDHYAVVAVGTDADGKTLVVAYSPINGGDAALTGLAHAQRLAANGGFEGEVIAVSPQWSIAARRRLAYIGTAPFGFRAVAASSLAEGASAVEVETPSSASWLPAARVGDRLETQADRDLFARGLAALEGLAAKHGGVVRGSGGRAELVLLARRVASLDTDEGAVSLETDAPERSREGLDSERLATAFDRLEGSLRKRLNDKRVRSGEEGIRADLWSALAEASAVRNPQAWPLGGAEPEIVDFTGVGEGGDPVVGALRSTFSVQSVGELLDAIAELQPMLPGVLGDAEAPLKLGNPRLVLAAKDFESGALAILTLLAFDHRTYDIVTRRGRGPELELRGEGAAAAEPRSRRRRPGRTPVKPSDSETAEEETVEADADESAPSRRGGNRRRRGRRGGARSNREPREGETEDGESQTERSPRTESAEGAKEAAAPEAGSIVDRAERFDSISLFDLDDDNGDDPPRRSRRGRGRRRRGGAGAAKSGSEESGSDDEPSGTDLPAEAGTTEDDEEARGGRRRRRGRGRKRGPRDSATEESSDREEPDTDAEPVDDDDVVDDDAILQVADVDVPDVVVDEPPSYDDESEDGVAEVVEVVEDAAPEADLRRPRKRVAIVAHADRGSVIAAILLARDLRMIEGFWVYPQEDLMTFFRGVATDLREDTPIYLVGFTATPARDTIGAASLYAGRIAWFDHHDWPPEDLNSLRETIGAKNVTVTPGNENSVSAVLTERIRRSRFSDKIVELGTGRFSQHDFERWGRVWWERLASIGSQSGDRRADVDALLVGRPSDLAREVERLPVPEPPAEVAFVAANDFRIVHFGGYRMVVVPVPPEFDLHLSLRVARERYDADMSLGYVEGGELVVLTGDEGRSQRNLDMLSMAAHLESKHDWIEKLPADDYVARIRIHGFGLHPDRLDEVVGQIAMGRSILEG
jgi:hypothetical protein